MALVCSLESDFVNQLKCDSCNDIKIITPKITHEIRVGTQKKLIAREENFGFIFRIIWLLLDEVQLGLKLLVPEWICSLDLASEVVNW